MITRYDIAFEKENIILIVNLDFFYEFADFDYKKYTKNLKKEIEKIAEKHNARIVKIVIGGVLISTLFLPITNKNDNINSFITTNTIKESLNNINDEDLIIDVSKLKEDTNSTTNNNIDTIIPNKNNIATNNNFNTTPPKIEITKPNISLPSNENTNNNTVITQKEDVKNEEINTNTYVTIHRSNGEIVKLELEEYLIGVVGSEMPASFNIEALKSQAIVARTYALKRINSGKTLTDTVSTQVYKNNDELKIMWGNDFDKYYNKVKNAVISTKGIVLMYNNNYIDAVYHSTSNGKTEDAIYVWGNDVPYLKSVDSKTDLNASSYERKITLTLEKLSNILNTTITKDTTIILERNTSGRVSNVKINDIEIKGTTFRSLLGLRSTDFIIELTENDVIITTHGYGHGVGMSQYGANGMANLGYTYEQILKHYYQSITLKKI